MSDLFQLDETTRKEPDLSTAWKAAMARLTEESPAEWAERFFRPMKPVSWENGVVKVSVPSNFVLNWARSKFLGNLQAYLGDEMGRPVVLDVVTQRHERGPSTQPIGGSPMPTRPADEGFVPGPKFTFDSFVVGQSNRLAVAGAKNIATDPGGRYNPLFIYGPPGVGKTHLLHAVAADVMACHPRLKVAYFSAQQFTEEFVNALQNNKIEGFRRGQKQVGVWLLDDVQFIAGKDKTQEEVFHLFNHLHQYGKQIVLTSDRPPRDLQLFDERLRSRFEAGLVADIQMPDTETRWAIVRKKAEMEGIEIDPEVANYLATHVPGNIRTLEGALTRLVALASVETNGRLDLDLADAMVDRYYRRVQEKLGFPQIVSVVSKHFKISVEEIQGQSRKAPIVHARHVAVYMTREITQDSWKHIGSLFGDRDHTSMMHGYQKIAQMMQDDRDLKTTVAQLMRNVRPDE